MSYKIKEIKTCISIDFEDAQPCFEALIKKIDRLEEQGYKLVSIVGNMYYFKKDDIEYTLIIRKEDESIY